MPNNDQEQGDAWWRKYRAQLLKHRDRLLNSKSAAHSEYDKSILTLSSGLLAVSIAFISGIVPPDKMSCVYILIVSWGLFGLSILLTLSSFVTSQQAHKHQTSEIDTYLSSEERVEFLPGPNPWSRGTEVLNIVSGCAFFLAVLLMILFAAINLIGAA